MTATLTHRGTTYTVEANTDEHKEMAPYIITSDRGRKYRLLRNQRSPHALFAIHDGKFGMPSGHWWFTDRDGTLKSQTP